MQALTMLDRSADLAGLVRLARRHAGLTQIELAERLGTTQSAVSRWERGGDEPRLSTFAEIVRACGLSASIVVDDGVDLAQIRQHLLMTPAERLQSVANVSALRATARVVSSV